MMREASKFQLGREGVSKFNFISHLLLLWIDPLFWRGLRRTIEQCDLYQHPRAYSSEKLSEDFDRYWKEELQRRQNGKKPRLFLAILRCLWLKMLVHNLLFFLEITCYVSQSVILGYLTNTFSDDAVVTNTPDLNATSGPVEIADTNRYLYIAGISVLAVIIVFTHAQAFLLAYTNAMLSNIIMVAAVYRKVLSLSQTTVSQVTVGHVVNLASNDVERLNLFFLFHPVLWVGPIHVAVVTYLVYIEVGWFAFLVTGFICIQIPLQVTLGRCYARTRFKSAVVTDKRVHMMNEVISGIRVIKMYAWEYAFKKVITSLRRKEFWLVLQSGFTRATSFAFINISLTLILFLLFTAYTASGGLLTPKRVFTTLSLLAVLRLTTVRFMSLAVISMMEGRVVITRLQKLLEQDELEPWKVLKNSTGQSSIVVKGVSASWTGHQSSKLVLDGLNFSMDRGLMSVIGPVGAGKSTLLQCLLHELKPVQGSIEVTGRLSYCSQDPWVYSATLRENVLFGSPYHREWYERVLQACALSKDIELLVNGDLTLVGERGVTLSGGQKARVNLARAVYHDADVYLLDDPLSAVDTAVGKHLMEHCLGGLLKDRLVVLVTHQVHFALKADKILVLKEGTMQAFGSHSDLLSKGLDSHYLEELVSPSSEEQQLETFTIPDSEAISDVPGVNDSSHCTQVLMPATHEKEEEVSLKDIAVINKKTNENSTILEVKEQGSISTAIYYHYVRAGAHLVFIIALCVGIFTGEASIVGSHWWLADWASCDDSQTNVTSSSSASATCNLTTDERIYIFAGMALFALMMGLLRTLALFYVFINAARVLHNRMFNAVLRAPVLFFDTNPIGRILNRFSKDIGFLDDLLPLAFSDFILLVSRTMASVMTAVVANWWTLLPALVFLVGVLGVRWYYLKTARNIRRLEAVARSPVYSHLSMTLQGLPTIRSFEKQQITQRQFQDFQNQHTQGLYLYLAAGRWLGLRVDILGAFFITAVSFFSVGLGRYISNPGLIGLSLTYTISLIASFQHTIQQSAEVENIMVSSERVMEYSKIKPEASLETVPPNKKPSKDWPSKGEIKLQNITFRYSPALPAVLKNVSFSVRHSEKIGIVGRTGAGKSTLLSVLYRLAEPHGQIIIDGVETTSIGLHDLRKKMSIIPQDPVLFSGSMRYNLDPSQEYSDAELWGVLEQVQLKAVVEELEGRLSGEVSEGGSNFSVGQRQLVCLARALLRKNKILILDEATANVDSRTDEIIQATIRATFSECTVLTIAHRLNTVMDSDRILVMNDGMVVEFDRPLALLKNRNSHLSQMVEKLGTNASKKLRQLATEADMV